MSRLASWLEALRDRLAPRRKLAVWHHELYRLPLHDLREALGIEPRRADLALWALHATPHRRHLRVHEARRATYGELSLVHTAAYLETITRPRELARVFGLDLDSFPVDAVMTTVRLACGGTIEATRTALRTGAPTVNLLGGFHHAFPDRGGGLCPVNDVAVALAVARGDGFAGRVVVVDLDAHPPDGTAACLDRDPAAWIGSLSGSDWGPLPHRVDETVLPDADDDAYLAALRDLLGRLPTPDLAFVIAGGDVLADDRMGRLQLTEAGARARDEAVATWLGDAPSVWVPGGGYQARAWRVLAGTVTTLLGATDRPVPTDLDPVAAHFAYVSRTLDTHTLRGRDDDDAWFTQEDVDALFGAHREGPARLLGYYSEQGVEHALWVFGVLTQLRRLGYDGFEVHLGHTDEGDLARLTGVAHGERHLLWELVVARQTLQGHPVLYMHWMAMRHPLGVFAPGRPRLPGQEVPGLGLAEEAIRLLDRMCDRLGLDGIVLRPAWFHTAYMGRAAFRFVDPARQGEFEALLRDLGHLSLPQLTTAIADGRVRQNGEPWPWPAEPMVSWRVPHDEDAEAVASARAATSFTLAPAEDG